MLVSDWLFSLSLSTTALFRPPPPLSAVEEGGGGVGVVLRVVVVMEVVEVVVGSSLLLRLASLSGVNFFGLPSGISFSSRLGTRD